MADWGVLTALQGQDNWQQRRYERQRETQLLAAQSQMMEQELSKQLQSAATIDEYMQTISQVKALEPDMQKVRDKESALRLEIQKGVSQYGGNVKKYLLSGGINALNKYRRNLLDSPEVQAATLNSAAYNEFAKDRKEGLTGRITSWQDIETGESKKGTFEQNYSDFVSGKTDRLNYRGGFKMPKFDEKIFTEFYGNQNRTYQPVTVNDYYRAAYDQFADLNDEDRQTAAMLHTQNYAQRLQNKATPLHWKFDDPMDRQLKMSMIQKNRAEARAAMIPQYYQNLLQSNQVSNPIIPADNRNNPLMIQMKDGTKAGIFSYTQPTEIAQKIAENQGFFVKDGQIQNKQIFTNTSNFYTLDGKQVDMTGIDANSILEATPLNQVIEINDGTNVRQKGMLYRVKISESGGQGTRVDGENIEGFFGNLQNVAGLRKVYNDKALGIFSIDQFYDDDDHAYYIDVIAPLNASPQAIYNVDVGMGIPVPGKGKVLQQAYQSGNQNMLLDAFNGMTQFLSK